MADSWNQTLLFIVSCSPPIITAIPTPWMIMYPYCNPQSVFTSPLGYIIALAWVGGLVYNEEDVHISPSRTNPGFRPGCLGLPKRTMACLDWDQQLPCPVRWNQFVKVVWESESFLLAVSFPNLDDAKGPVSLRFPQAKKYIFSLHRLQRSRHSLLPRLWL